MHPRRAIREEFRKRLSTAVDGVYPTAAKDRVHASRIAPVDTDDDEELPAILIYARDDRRDPDKDYGHDGADSWAESDLSVVVEGIVRGSSNVDDKLDDLAEQIEAALEDWNIPGFESARVRLGETEIDVIADGRKPVGAIGLTFQVRHRRAWRPETTPEPAIPTEVDRILWGDPPEKVVTP